MKPDQNPSIINIALVGGGDLCKDILEKTTFGYEQENAIASIHAVCDPDPTAPGIVFAKKMGLLTFKDYHELYDRRYSIHLIIILTPEQVILEDILNTRPIHIRILSYNVFKVFWDAIGLEERKLKVRTVEMETILNGIQDFILVITPDKEIVDVNEAFLNQMRYSREKLIGRKCYDVFSKIRHQDESCKAHCPLDKIIQDKKPSQMILNQLDHRGNPRYIEVTTYPIWEKDGQVSRFIEISRNITKRRTEEEEITRRLEQMVEHRTRQLKETHNKLLHQDKMASLGKLAASVVHEINNPVAGILNLTLLIKRIISEGAIEQKDIEQFKQYLDLMETETRRTSRIISNLLSFSRQSKIELDTLNINNLIEKTIFLNANLLKINRISVEKHFFPDIPRITGSEDQLQQVFMNIISNAAEAMEMNGNGILRIETVFSSIKDAVTINFHDTGVGIPDENIPKLFEPFFTTKKAGKGVGLGLSVVYGIIQEHVGTISVESNTPKGTTFIVELPATQPLTVLND
ncbi:MAG: PAS domain-containing protein [Deltaproteobacteria bacterium]|nr:PAS domain-containing protein [Deltaproteobacteria bacterium]